jgi:hypothetical protein
VVLVLAAGTIIRLAVDLAQGPAVYQDSLVYITLSEDAPFRFRATRPNGYPVVMRVLSLVGEKLDVVTMAQHVAGLLVGLLVYALLVRLGVRRWMATLTTALVVLNAYAVALEQDILSETFFTLTITSSAYLLLAASRRTVAVVTSGLFLAMAVTIRVVGIFAVPVWIAYVLVSRPGWRKSGAAILAVAAPLLAYCTFHAAHGRGFGFTSADGWFLYGKVGPIVDCSGASVPVRTRPLCDGPRGRAVEFYLYDRTSPAHVLFFGPTEPVNVDEDWNAENSGLLRRFSVGVIRGHPVSFARVVVKDFFRYLGPNPAAVELTLYGEPGTLTHAYERWLHVPWWTVSAALVTAVVALIVGRPGFHFRETLFLLGLSLSLLLGAAATAGFNPRYLVPLTPLILAAGALAAHDLLGVRTPKAPPERDGQLALPI